jgi:hypothetical protein
MHRPVSSASPCHDSKAPRQFNDAQVGHLDGKELMWGVALSRTGGELW